MRQPSVSARPAPELTVDKIRALSDLDNITVRIPDVAANLAVFRYRLRDELRSSTLPQLIARLNIRHANIHKAAELIPVCEDAQRNCRLVRSRPASNVDNEPRIRDLNVPGSTLAIPSAQNAAAEHPFIEISRSIDVGDGDKKRDGKPITGRHLIALWFDMNAHSRPQFR